MAHGATHKEGVDVNSLMMGRQGTRGGAYVWKCKGQAQGSQFFSFLSRDDPARPHALLHTSMEFLPTSFGGYAPIPLCGSSLRGKAKFENKTVAWESFGAWHQLRARGFWFGVLFRSGTGFGPALESKVLPLWERVFHPCLTCVPGIKIGRAIECD